MKIKNKTIKMKLKKKIWKIIIQFKMRKIKKKK